LEARHIQGDAEIAGVENAGEEIEGEGKVWKAKVLKMCFCYID